MFLFMEHSWKVLEAERVSDWFRLTVRNVENIRFRTAVLPPAGQSGLLQVLHTD